MTAETRPFRALHAMPGRGGRAAASRLVGDGDVSMMRWSAAIGCAPWLSPRGRSCLRRSSDHSDRIDTLAGRCGLVHSQSAPRRRDDHLVTPAGPSSANAFLADQVAMIRASNRRLPARSARSELARDVAVGPVYLTYLVDLLGSKNRHGDPLWSPSVPGARTGADATFAGSTLDSEGRCGRPAAGAAAALALAGEPWF